MGIQSIQAPAPEAALEVEPVACASQAFRSQLATTALAVALVVDQGGLDQDLQVPRVRRPWPGHGPGAREWRGGSDRPAHERSDRGRLFPGSSWPSFYLTNWL